VSAYSRIGRVGVIVPPENPTVEPEMVRLMPSDVSVHTMRLPVVEAPLNGRIEAYNQSLGQMVAGFGGLRLNCIYYAMTGGSYLMGPEVERETVERFASAGTVLVTAGQAIRRVLDDLAVDQIVLVSPYPDWLTEAALAYWEASGITVLKVIKVPTGTDGIYGIQAQEVVDAVGGTMAAQSGAVVLSGTGMPTLSAARDIGEGTSLPVVSSSLAAAAEVHRLIVEQSGMGALDDVRDPALRRLLGPV